MWILEHFSRHSHGFYTFFCAGKVFASMDGDILSVKEGKLPEIVFSENSRIPCFSRTFPENSRIPAGRMF